MKVVTLFPLVFLLILNLSSAQQKAPLNAEDFVVASISEGMDSSGVQKILGKPRTVASRDNPFDVGARLVTWKYSGLIIHMDKGNAVNGITITSKRFTTRRGLRVGDSIGKLLSLYGEPSGKYQSNWDYEEDHLHVMRITLKKQKVAIIYLGWLLD